MELPLSDLLAFAAILFIHHLLIMIALSNMSGLFVLTESGKPLRGVNIPIAITSFRLTSLPAIVYLIVLMEDYPVLPLLIIYTLLAFLTDLIDGNLSRRYKQTTKIGAYLDSTSDYAVLIAISIAYIIYGILPNWFFVLVMLRLFFQWVAATLLAIIHQSIVPHHSSLLAKLSVCVIMVMYGIALLQFIPATQSVYPRLIQIMQWIASPILILSLGEKIVSFIADLPSSRKQ